MRPEPEIVSIHVNVLGEACVEDTRQNPLLDLAKVLIGRDDRRQLLVVAVVEDLVELLLRPRCGVFGAEIVENEQLGAPNGVEPLVISDAVAGVEGRPEVIEEVGNDRKEHALMWVPRHEIQRNGDREMRLSAAATSVQEEPTLGSTAKRLRRNYRLVDTWNRLIEGVKRPVQEGIEV